MSLQDQYRKNAADFLERASRQADNADKSRLLLMAEAWRDLADRVARPMRKQRVTVDHPLIERALGPDLQRPDRPHQLAASA
jgi:hypothetical protein